MIRTITASSRGWLCASFLLLALPATAEDPLALFESHDLWQSAPGVAADGSKLVLEEDDAPGAAFLRDWQDAGPLLSSQRLGDSIVRLEVLLPEGSRAGLYLLGRYEVHLANARDREPDVDSMGALAPRWDEARDPPGYDGVAPKTDAALGAGQWQQVEVRVRAPRYDDAGAKTESALLLDVTVNGETVQRNTIATGITRGSIQPWEEPTGPLMLRAHEGPVAIRNVELARANYDNLALPSESGGETNEDELVDFVAQGKKRYTELGCASCHAVSEGEASVRAGPNLYGLFQRDPRDREVEDSEGNRYALRADRSYLHSSLRDPDGELAIVESGENRGQAYQALMPAYSSDSVSDEDIDAMGAYLRTLNALPEQGPLVHLVAEGGPEVYDPLADGLQRLVDDRLRIQRGPMAGMSGRSIHVGQPNGVNYSFDPRVLGIVRLWQGGFLDMGGELRNRGGGALSMGYNSREFDLGEERLLFAPLNRGGELIDFAFKEAVYQDFDTIEAALYSEEDHLDRVEAQDAGFLGYHRDSGSDTQAPVFRYRVGENRIEVGTQLDDGGEVTIAVTGELADGQKFRLHPRLQELAEVSAGELRDGHWYLPEGASLPAKLTTRIPLSANPWRPEPSDFEYPRQPLKVVDSQARLIDGYRIQDYLAPKDNYGRDLLFEPLGLAVTEDGTVVVATRNAGIWRIVDGEWHLFAEGFFDSLGVEVEDQKGLDLVVGQKAELTRVRDTSGDGRADRFDTLFDSFSFHSNYHTYMHGPVKGADGAYYVNLNLAHTDEAIYKADGLYMGAQGGFSGWVFRVTLDGDFEPWSSGWRSAAGMTRGPDDRIWITENQGEFVGTSKLFVLEEGVFYGHPSGLVDLPGMTPDSPEIAWENVKDDRARELLLMPQNLLANSPGHPVWDLTEGKFGPFEGQMLIGDQTQSNLFRVAMETLPDGTEQGAAMPFASQLASGAMRPVFLPDGSLLLGQTGRGWQARGGHIASLQRIVWDGETRPLALERVTAEPDGFVMHFTGPLPDELTLDELSGSLAIESWAYRDAPDYGSERLGVREEAFDELQLSEDRTRVRLSLERLDIPEVHPQQSARVYHLVLDHDALSADHGEVPLSAFYTLHHFPEP